MPTLNSDQTQGGQDLKAANRRLGLILVSVALAFFVGFLIKQWLFA